jgi:hypothetical protein
MLRTRRYGQTFAATVAAFVSLSVIATAHAAVLSKTTHGSPTLKSADVLGFAPDGVLLIGDGQGAQIFAVKTNEKAAKQALQAKIEGINTRVAERLGTKADGIEIVDLAVNPETGLAYLAVRKQDDKRSAVLTVDANGKIGEFVLESVDYVRIALPAGDQSPVNRITDVAWADDRLIAAAAASEEFASKIFVVRGPLAHEAQGTLHSAETYHVAHHKWETKAPMSTVMPYRENGQTYVVGAFACTPVVKYPLEDLSPGAKVKGISMVELGSGNRPLDMFTYRKDGKEYVLSNTFRMHHQKRPFGPSPYWTVRFERSLLGDNEKVNEQAVQRLTQDYQPATDRIQFIDSFNGVMQMDQLDDRRALVLRTDGQGRLDLEAVELP